MTAILRATLVAALIVTSSPAIAAGQQPSSDILVRRIDSLERKVANLEQRVRELEALVKVEPSRERPVAKTANWHDIANWRRLRRGMTPDQVRDLIGEPEKVDVMSSFTIWQWGRGSEYATVSFADDKVTSWSEPGH
jgi:outer membrane protein assembly factor BamE (lipoprotein component of BamABCDE complex)